MFSRVLPRARPLLARSPVSRFSTAASLDPEAEPVPETNPKRVIQKYLQPSLGVTGVWTLGLGILTTLISKEYFILHAETPIVAVDLGIIIFFYRRFGKQIAAYFDKGIDELTALFYKERRDQVTSLEDKISTEEQTEDMLSVRHDLYELEKETNQLALQVEYERRQEMVKKEVKNRLEYHLELERLNRRLEHEMLVEWLNGEVIASITPEQQRTTLTQCISTLKGIAQPL